MLLQAGFWEQCGGMNAAGVSEASRKQCCASGSACTKINDYYWQCKPNNHQAATASGTVAACSINVSWMVDSDCQQCIVRSNSLCLLYLTTLALQQHAGHVLQ